MHINLDECRKFLLKKFGINGYTRSKMYFDDKEYKKYLDEITELALDSDKFALKIKKVNGIYICVECKYKNKTS